jgi:hypothetical protein
MGGVGGVRAREYDAVAIGIRDGVEYSSLVEGKAERVVETEGIQLPKANPC